MVINHLLILLTGMILQVLEITKTKIYHGDCFHRFAEIRIFQECSFAHDRDEIRRGQKKKLSKAASSKATEQVEQCSVDLGLWGLYFPLYGGSKKKGDEKIFDQIARAFLGTFHRDPADVGILLGVLGH